MSTKKWIALAGILAGLVLLIGLAVQASPPGQQPGPQGGVGAQGSLGTAFTYQGQLKSGGEPVNEDCEMAFRLYEGESGDNQVGSAITHTVPISDGLFTVNLDFGSSAFTGDGRWLGIQVQCPGDAAYADMGRQALTATPYALYATRATTATYALGSGDADTVNGLHGDAFWQVSGNAGTTPGVNYLGTSDSVTLTLAVSGTAALRLVPHTTSPNVIGGHSANSVTASAHGATIGGGGNGIYPNRVTTGTYGTIGGGLDNTAGGWATVSGGHDNTASGLGSTVGGGYQNTASNFDATIAGGRFNAASGLRATIGGGQYISVTGQAATVSGGSQITVSGDYATVGGGYNITVTSYAATVNGGHDNTASGDGTTVAGGYHNTASQPDATVGGGRYNTASGEIATVVGGGGNTASGTAATVAGGEHNTASGDYSFAAGRQAKAVHPGTFVWADTTNVAYTSTITNQFAIRASNGVSLSVNAGSSKAIAVGERYRDNAIIAWAKVDSDGSVVTNSFGVESVAHIDTGHYAITVRAQTDGAALLIPMAVAEVVDPLPTPLPIVLISQISAQQFDVYVFDVSVTADAQVPEPIDNDFVFMVTGR